MTDIPLDHLPDREYSEAVERHRPPEPPVPDQRQPDPTQPATEPCGPEQRQPDPTQPATGPERRLSEEGERLPGEEYRGPATLRIGAERVPVQVRLSARFEPVEGRLRWAGRTGPDRSLHERVGAGLREAVIVIAGSPARPVRLGEPDPWGGIRLTGTGTPPWFPA